MRGRVLLGLSSASVLAAALLSADQVSARGVVEVLPVSACKVESGVAKYNWDGISNTTTAPLVLQCAVPLQGASHGAAVDRATQISVWAYVAQASKPVKCSAAVMYGTTAPQWSASEKSTTATGIRDVTWYPPNSPFGAAYVRCTLPPASGSSSSLQPRLVGIFQYDNP